MTLVSLHDKNVLQAHLSHRPLLHLYELGDLDDFFWPHTTWYGLEDGGSLRQVALLYTETELPVLICMNETPDTVQELLRGLRPILPHRVYCHLPAEALSVLADDYEIQSRTPHYRMGLTDFSDLARYDTSMVQALTMDDYANIERFYRASYPGNWFVPRMVETGQFYGIREGLDFVSIAGIHVYSPEYGVAALGNIATDTAHRGRGLAVQVCAALCQNIRAKTPHIGLNVSQDNWAAIACYEKLGFSPVTLFTEAMLERNR